MPDRDDAEYARPRLYTEDDDKWPDDVGLVLDALEEELDRAMDDGDDHRVWHTRRVMHRVASAAGEGYADRVDADGGPPPDPAPEQGTE